MIKITGENMLKMLPIVRHLSYSRTHFKLEEMNLMNEDLKTVDCSPSQVSLECVQDDEHNDN